MSAGLDFEWIRHSSLDAVDYDDDDGDDDACHYDGGGDVCACSFVSMWTRHFPRTKISLQARASSASEKKPVPSTRPNVKHTIRRVISHIDSAYN